jgi:hypothetical protein
LPTNQNQEQEKIKEETAFFSKQKFYQVLWNKEDLYDFFDVERIF